MVFSKRIILLLISISIIISIVFSSYVSANFDIAADNALLIEHSTGHIIYGKNIDERMPPASITKLMTLLVIFDAIEDGRISLDDQIKTTRNAWETGQNTSTMFLNEGQIEPLSVLITGISVVSANDACVAIAEYLYGSEDGFVNVMNQTAENIGLTNSHFMNTTGLPAQNHYMSAKDIAALAQHLIEKHPDILEYEKQKEMTFNDIHQYNRNPLLGVYEGADGLKTGWTTEAGFCLVGTAEKDDMRLISVVLNTSSEEERLSVSRQLLNYGFQNYTLKQLVRKGRETGEVLVKEGKELAVPIEIDRDIKAVIPIGRENDLELALKDPETLTAPVSKGTYAGELELMLDDEIIAQAKAVTSVEVERIGFFARLFRRIGEFFRSLID